MVRNNSNKRSQEDGTTHKREGEIMRGLERINLDPFHDFRGEGLTATCDDPNRMSPSRKVSGEFPKMNRIPCTTTPSYVLSQKNQIHRHVSDVRKAGLNLWS